MPEFLRKADVENHFDRESWEIRIFSEFSAALTSAVRPFPCTFGVKGFERDELRFCFPDPLDARTLGPVLRRYLNEARTFGRFTSLVAFSRPGPVQTLEHYRDRFWSLLDDLAALDDVAWPPDIPRHVDDPLWEFSFNGEPIFVVCNTPAHIIRQSRRASAFMVTFQPRWVFDPILSRGSAHGTAITVIRKRLAAYDFIPPSPDLGAYGAPGNFEARQYFLNDENLPEVCPFDTLGDPGRKEKVA